MADRHTQQPERDYSTRPLDHVRIALEARIGAVSFQVIGTSPAANEVLLFYPVISPFTLPANLVGSRAAVLVNPSATFVIDIQRQVAGAGAFTLIASISITTGGVVTMTTVSSTSKAIAANDVLKIIGDADGDATFQGAVNLYGV